MNWDIVFESADDRVAALAVIASPDFENATRVHDWRNHVPEPFKRGWQTLHSDARLAVYYMATLAAGAEEWE